MEDVNVGAVLQDALANVAVSELDEDCIVGHFVFLNRGGVRKDQRGLVSPLVM
jgi:hypothetical protein